MKFNVTLETDTGRCNYFLFQYFLYYHSIFYVLVLIYFQTMVTSVSSLLKTVRSVEDEASRGVRAIESTVDAVKQAVLVS